MRAFHVAATAALLGTASCGACQPDKTPPPAASASASTAAIATAPPVVSHVPHNAPPPKLACRIVALDGDAHIETPGADSGGPPPLPQGLAPAAGGGGLG